PPSLDFTFDFLFRITSIDWLCPSLNSSPSTSVRIVSNDRHRTCLDSPHQTLSKVEYHIGPHLPGTLSTRRTSHPGRVPRSWAPVSHRLPDIPPVSTSHLRLGSERYQKLSSLTLGLLIHSRMSRVSFNGPDSHCDLGTIFRTPL